MASILDQYEEESQRAAAVGTVTPLQGPIGPGFIDARLESDVTIFNKKKVNFKPPDPISHLVVCNNFLVMAMTNNMMLRLDLEHPDQPDEVELPRIADDRVHRLFLDPTGRHLLISMTSTENYYLSRNSKKARPVTKLKGHLIDSVGWNLQNANENTTGAILLGTSKGLIFETELADSGDNRFFHGSLEQYLKQLFNLGKEKAAPITGIEFDRMPTDSMTEYRYYILATTPARIYQFIGNVSKSAEPPMFQHLFQQYESGAGQFQELPGDFGHSELKLFLPKFRGQAQTLAWMAGPGVYYGRLDLTGSVGSDAVMSDMRLIPYPRDGEEKQQNPMSMVLTEFHVLLLYPDKLKVVCVLNEQLIFDDVYPERFGRLIGLCKDPIRGSIWAYTSQNVFKYKVTREGRDVWQMYLERNEFDLAKEYCKGNAAQMDRVLTKHAEFLFEHKRYEDSAMMYAQTQNSFEEIALKFIKLDRKDALKSFIHRKLLALRTQDKTQMTMLVTWLIEIYLNQLGEMKEADPDETNPEYSQMQEEFRQFLANPKFRECVSYNRGVVYDLIASHGNVEDMVFFAMLMEDFEKVITHFLQHDDYKRALSILENQSDVELVYKFSPLLMQYIPKETVSLWIKKKQDLDPKSLIPALVQYDHNRYREQGNEAIRYLEFCIETMDNKDQAIHNYLLSLYAKIKENKLMTYLQMQGMDPESICYDLKYALRLCSEHGHKRACVHIYSLMELYEEAVDLALDVDVELAKEMADKPEDDEDLKKKLWLRIARHVVEKEKDVKRAMEFLHDCDLLKIEDILPFFPDFVTIDHFKDAIVTSLQEYNRHIEELRDDMDEATKSAEEIRKEIQSFRNKYAFVNAQDKCAACGFPLMMRGFYVFPCSHKFHNDCLIGEVLPNLTSKKRQRVEELQRKLAEHDDMRTMSEIKTGPGSEKRSPVEIKAELDDLVASECIYCGDFMVRCIDKPFIDDEEPESVLFDWL